MKSPKFWYPEGDANISYLLVIDDPEDFHEIAVTSAKNDKDAKMQASKIDTGSTKYWKDYKVVARNKKQYQAYMKKYGW